MSEELDSKIVVGTVEAVSKMQAELDECKKQLAGMPKLLRLDDDILGWTLDYKQIQSVSERTRDSEYFVGMEEVEAVMLAMADLGFARVERKSDE